MSHNHKQCPCEKVVEGVKFAGFLSFVALGLTMAAIDGLLNKGCELIEEALKPTKTNKD